MFVAPSILTPKKTGKLSNYQDLSRHKVDECSERESSQTCCEDGIEELL